jgi:hypothetical protein
MSKFASIKLSIKAFIKGFAIIFFLFFFCVIFKLNVSALTVTYNCTGADQTFIVPTGVTEITVQAYGAGGGSGSIVAGAGGYSSGTFTVVPGDNYLVVAGCKGIKPTSGTYGGGGYGGGGNAYYGGGITGGGGGGRSAFIKVGSADSATNSVIAGGGGGGPTGSGGSFGTQAGGGVSGQSYESYTTYGGAGGSNGVGGIKGSSGNQTAGGAIIGGNGSYACGTGNCGSSGGGGGGYGGGGGGGQWNYGGYYTAIGGGGGGGKAGPNGVTTVGGGSAAGVDGYVVVTYTPDVTAPTLLANNNSSTWYNTQRSATVSASDAVSLAEVRYYFGASSQMNAGCTSGGTVTANASVLNSTSGGTTLYLCARDASGNVSTWNGIYNWESTAPSNPSKMTISGGVVGDNYVNTSFVANIPSGSSDSGGSNLHSYSLSRCDNVELTTNCTIVASGISGSTVTVSGANLPADGSIKYYYWTSVDNAGNTSDKSSTEYIRMDSSAPSLPSMVAEPEYTTGTSNTVYSTIATDSGIGGVEYNFCKSMANLSSPFVECNTVGNQSGWVSSNSAEFADLTPGQIYYYYVKVRDSILNTTAWVGVSSSTQGNTIQAPPEPAVIPVLASDWNTDVSGTGQNGVVPIGVADAVDTSIKIAEMEVDFSSAPNWTGVTGGAAETKAFFHSTQSISTITNGAVSSYSLFVKKGEGDKVWICPGAATLSAVSLSCSGGFYLTDGQTVNGATASIEGIYWKISGLTGTGGMSIITGLRDTLSRLEKGVGSDHTITFGTNFGISAGQDIQVWFDPGSLNFDLSSITISDLELSDNVNNVRNIANIADANNWGVSINSGDDVITFTAPTNVAEQFSPTSQIVVRIGTNAGGTNQIINPSSLGSYIIRIVLNNTAPGEMGEVNIPIIDSDIVDISGYVSAYINFDIDSNTDNSECDSSGAGACLTHSAGSASSSYTIDFGELTSAIVNKSLASSLHADGLNGLINSIYFDLTTNAPGGAVVTVKSLNSGLKGPGTNLISSIADGSDISSNSGKYGFNLTASSTQKHGTIIPNSQCNSLTTFCGPLSTGVKTVFDTNNLPIDGARVRMDLAAAASYTNNPGVYTDTLTFVATGTF